MVWRVKESYSYDHVGVPTTVRAGTLLGDEDPRAVGREQYLERAEDAATRTAETRTAVETATAAPGEHRTRSAPRRAQPQQQQ